MHARSMQTLRGAARRWCPPAMVTMARRALETIGIGHPARLYGRFADWQAARAATTGYEVPVIVERVAKAVQKVLDGEAAYERDSVTFAEPEWPWPLLAALGAEAAREDGRLRVLDFGGSLGGTFLMARRFFGTLRELRWHVVEQPHFVARATSLTFPSGLAFFETIAAATRAFAPNVVIASGVLHYLERPFETLEELMEVGARTLIVDRTPCIAESHEVISVQHVPPSIFPASYPSWLFPHKRIPEAVQQSYRTVARFRAEDILHFEGGIIEHWGWIFARNSEDVGERA